MTHWARTLDAALEASFLLSFSRVGFSLRNRAERWPPPETLSLDGRVILLTGGTSGIGRAAAEQLARARATLVLLARDPERTRATAEAITAASGNDRVSALHTDMGDPDAVRSAAEQLLRTHARLDVLIHNAGAVHSARRVAPGGLEATVASQVVGPFLLTALLAGLLARSAPARVLTMSSGGMYLAPLRVPPELAPERYDGPRQYALAKRAQVVLNELWAERLAPAAVACHALHPGWVDTPGVREGLPRFARLLRPLLRSPAEGADGLVWLAAADGAALGPSGGFWLDRRRRGVHRLPSTRRSDSAEARRALWAYCLERSGWDGDLDAVIRAAS